MTKCSGTRQRRWLHNIVNICFKMVNFVIWISVQFPLKKTKRWKVNLPKNHHSKQEIRVEGREGTTLNCKAGVLCSLGQGSAVQGRRPQHYSPHGQRGVDCAVILHRKPRFLLCPRRWQCVTVKGDRQAWSGRMTLSFWMEMSWFWDSVDWWVKTLSYVTWT